MKNLKPDPNFCVPDNLLTLTVVIYFAINTPPKDQRERFRQGITDAVLHLLRRGNFQIEYIGYINDKNGRHDFNNEIVDCEDFVYASFIVTNSIFTDQDIESTTDEVIATFIRVFEDKTHRHLEIDSIVSNRETKQRFLKMSSNWTFFRKHG
ncbi:hypothetical protein [Flavobacterium sp.]|uniref:hypothetical protein n=1 Tax=Flavobacterium sp. TaxID=239 RepID=UPI002619CF2B|nr:hypothetical protein [Flavobacterium sp.]